MGKRQVVAEKGWQLSQSNNTKSQNLDADFKNPNGLGQRTWLGQRHGKDDSSVVSMQISIRRRRQCSPMKETKDEFRDFWAEASCRLPHTLFSHPGARPGWPLNACV